MTMFTPDGLAYYLNAAKVYEDDGDRPSVPVTFGGTHTVEVTVDDLTCPECGEGHDPVEDAAARWLAANKVLNGGLCAECDAYVTVAGKRRHAFTD